MSDTRQCGSCGKTTAYADACLHCGADPNIGRVVAGKVRIDERLGGGGMASVYAGTHLDLGEPVAVKFLRREFALDATIRKRFRREAVALARLRHPCIVSILDFGEEDDELYAVMELVAGTTLEDVRKAGRMSLLRAGPIFDQLLAALELCHAGGVVHRDLKPGNVMIVHHDGADMVKLIDFGIAHAAKAGDEKLTSTGLIQGTVQYMAPEQCRGEEVFAAADIYAVGVMMYELLTGTTPYDADNAASYMVQHIFVDPPPMRSIEPSIPVGIEALVRRAMAKSGDARPTARVLRQELASALKGTDPHSLAEASATERKRTGGLAREERALTSRARPNPVLDAGANAGARVGLNAGAAATEIPASAGPPSAAPPNAIPPNARSVDVVLWMPRDPRSGDLRGALAVAGLGSTPWPNDADVEALAERTSSGVPVVVVVSARHDAMGRLGTLRARHPRVPVVVVDVADPQETAALIRAGAADFALEGGGDGELGAKIERLARRRMRRPS